MEERDADGPDHHAFLYGHPNTNSYPSYFSSGSETLLSPSHLSPESGCCGPVSAADWIYALGAGGATYSHCYYHCPLRWQSADQVCYRDVSLISSSSLAVEWNDWKSVEMKRPKWARGMNGGMLGMVSDWRAWVAKAPKGQISSVGVVVLVVAQHVTAGLDGVRRRQGSREAGTCDCSRPSGFPNPGSQA